MSWVRTAVPLVGDEPVSATARALGLIDIANGLTPRRPTDEVAFPNVDLTVHLVAAPRSDWLGFDTTVTFGPAGLGLTHTVLHDTERPARRRHPVADGPAAPVVRMTSCWVARVIAT